MPRNRKEGMRSGKRNGVGWFSSPISREAEENKIGDRVRQTFCCELKQIESKPPGSHGEPGVPCANFDLERDAICGARYWPD